MSLGRAWAHKFPNKLDQAEKYGFTGIELFFEDLEYIASEMDGGATPVNQLKAAKQIRKLCDERNITVIGLQPFWQYEGLRDREEHAARIEKLKVWFKLARALGTDLIQIPSNFLSEEEATGDMDEIVKDMIEVADLGARETPVIRFVYESLAWGTYVDTWDRCWEVVERVNRPNFGICLDTFNIAGRVYADPAAPSGKTPNAEADIQASIERLVKSVDVKKVFYIQVVDAERLQEPLRKGHEFYQEGAKPRMCWSRNCRLFYGEEDRGGYLPVKDVAEALLKELKFDGWVSMELFNRVMAYEEPDIPEQLARRGAESWRKLVRDLDLQTA